MGSQFIDLGLLLKSTKEINDYLGGHREVQFHEGKFCVYQQKTPTFLTIDKWITAFVIYISVMLEKYRTHSQELLKYLKDIRLAAARSPTCWYRYDEQFRLRMADDPHACWGQINQEYWLLYVNSNSNSTANSQSESYEPPSRNVILCVSVKNILYLQDI
jgi:hypothetical protein